MKARKHLVSRDNRKMRCQSLEIYQLFYACAKQRIPNLFGVVLWRIQQGDTAHPMPFRHGRQLAAHALGILNFAFTEVQCRGPLNCI